MYILNTTYVKLLAGLSVVDIRFHRTDSPPTVYLLNYYNSLHRELSILSTTSELCIEHAYA